MSNDKDIEQYTQWIAEHGATVQGLGWNSEGGQRLRWKVLSEVYPLSGCSILDVGAGFGGFATYLKEQDIPFADYVGIDITRAVVDAASCKYKILISDIADAPLSNVVFASGIFGTEGTAAQWRRTINQMWGKASNALAFNMLSSLAGDGPICRLSPAEVFMFCRELTPWVSLAHNYMPHDFTIYMYRNQCNAV